MVPFQTSHREEPVCGLGNEVDPSTKNREISPRPVFTEQQRRNEPGGTKTKLAGSRVNQSRTATRRMRRAETISTSKARIAGLGRNTRVLHPERLGLSFRLSYQTRPKNSLSTDYGLWMLFISKANFTVRVSFGATS
jgi:hypothetical protein